MVYSVENLHIIAPCGVIAYARKRLRVFLINAQTFRRKGLIYTYMKTLLKVI